MFTQSNLTTSLQGLGIILVLTSSMGINPEVAQAGGCNPFGCSKSNAAECNPFGCPNPPMGGKCTPFGCPDSPQPPPNNPSPNTLIVVPNGGMSGSNSNTGGSGQAIAICMQSLLYDKFGNRTPISENTAVQACRNAQ